MPVRRQTEACDESEDPCNGGRPKRRARAVPAATRRDVFLSTMNEIVPCQTLCGVIEPHDPKTGNGRPPVGLERTLRMYFVHFTNLLVRKGDRAARSSARITETTPVGAGRIMTGGRCG